MKIVISLHYSVVFIVGFSEFSNRFNFHLCQTLVTLTIQINYNALMNLEIKIGISL